MIKIQSTLKSVKLGADLKVWRIITDHFYLHQGLHFAKKSNKWIGIKICIWPFLHSFLEFVYERG